MCKSEFTEWAIIEELSIRRRLRTFLISWGQKTRVKHCYVDLSSWYEHWFAIICIDMDVILDLSTTLWHNTTILETVSNAWVNSKLRIFFYWNTTTWNNIITDVSLLVQNVKIKCEEYCYIPRWPAGVKSNHVSPTGFPDCAITYHVSTLPAVGAAKHHRQNTYLTAMFGHYIGGYFNY